MMGVPLETPPVGTVVINRSLDKPRDYSDSSSDKESDSSSSTGSSDEENIERLKKLCHKIKRRVKYLESKKKRKSASNTEEDKPVDDQDFFKYLDDYEKELK